MRVFDTAGNLQIGSTGNMKSYDTGWIACSDWTNQHLGTTLGGNVVHNLNTPISDLLIKVLISSDGTDANAFEIQTVTRAYDSASPSAVSLITGYVLDAVDNNNFIVQTGEYGFSTIGTDGTLTVIDSESWYYKVKVYKLVA